MRSYLIIYYIYIYLSLCDLISLYVQPILYTQNMLKKTMEGSRRDPAGIHAFMSHGVRFDARLAKAARRRVGGS